MTKLDSYFSLAGKVAIVTGAGGHLCSSISEALCDAGATVVVSDLREKKANEITTKLTNLGHDAISWGLDAKSKHGWLELRSFVMGKYGKVDILINGAGINSSTAFNEIELDEWREVFAAQIDTTFLGCQTIGETMCSRKAGSIINISSASAGPPLSKAFAYSASKASIVNLTKNLAREWAKDNVRVNAIRPGFFPTKWNRINFITPEREKQILGHTPMSRFGEPNELGGAVIWLSSDSASFVTGSEIAIDGGFSCMTI